MKSQATMRAGISAVVILGFLGVLARDLSNELMLGALISAFTQVISYYLGSSQGAHETRSAMTKLFERQVGAPGEGGGK